MSQRLISRSESDTRRIAQQFAQTLVSGDVVLLSGDLGAGKTQFCKGIAAHFGVPEHKVHSPTFAIVHEYEGALPLYHFDCYRLGSRAEALEIGLEEYVFSGGISLVEWPERLSGFWPEHSKHVHIKSINQKERQISIL